jgi:hypothetical protein
VVLILTFCFFELVVCECVWAITFEFLTLVAHR